MARHAFLSVKFLYFSAGYKDIFCKLIARQDVLLIVEHDGIIRNNIIFGVNQFIVSFFGNTLGFNIMNPQA